MGRPLRTDTSGAWHHVMNRGAGRRVVFHADDERTRFLELIGQMDERFETEIHAFCLLGNHYHLLVRSREPRLSEAMKWVGSVYTREVNAERGVDGAVFRGRFHSVRVEREAHLDWLFRYINANPLDLGWEKPLADYPWSGLSASIGAGGPTWLRTDYIRSRFGEDPAALERFVEAARTSSGERPSQHRDVTWSDVVAAAELTLAPGPEIHTEADARTVSVVAAIDRWSVNPDEVREACGATWVALERQLDRCRSRIANRSELASYGNRIDDLLWGLAPRDG